jgi:hypothetical protein
VVLTDWLDAVWWHKVEAHGDCVLQSTTVVGSTIHCKKEQQHTTRYGHTYMVD